MWKIWIDTGGTFTDCLAQNPSGETSRIKILSNGSLRGTIEEIVNETKIIAQFNWPIATDIFEGFTFYQLSTNNKARIKNINLQTGEITLSTAIKLDESSKTFEITAHEEVPVLVCRLLTQTALNQQFPNVDLRLGTTRGTNALLERKGAPVTLLITKGFKDLLKIGTQQRPHLFELNIQTPPVLYQNVFEIDERINADGNILKSMENLQVESIQKQIDPLNTSIAITLINSYKNDVHEQQLSKLFRGRSFKHISVSSELSSNIKLLPRAQTTVVNAYLSPIMLNYVEGITSKLNQEIDIMTSAGSIMKSGSFTPKDGLLSGPAGGILGAATVAKSNNINHIVTFDMGGTSTDVAIYNNQINYTYETKVGDAIIQSPAIDIDTIASGGGSICAINNGLLEVGPSSAGASPGPACYGNGGPLTITDINLLSGRLSDQYFAIPISKYASKDALKKVTGNDDNDIATLQAFLQVANEKMAAAIKKVATKKGFNLQNLALVTYGGAGGQHACDLAEILKINNILIPYDAGLLSAYGIGQADIDSIKQLQVLEDFTIVANTLEQYWSSLEVEAASILKEQGYHENDIYVKHKFIHMRLAGQESTIEIDSKRLSATEILESFKLEYKKLFGHWLDNLQVEIESLKLILSVKKEGQIAQASTITTYQPTPVHSQNCIVESAFQPIDVYIWEHLKAGAHIEGPALIVSNNCTVFLKNNWLFSLNSNMDAVLSAYSASTQHRKPISTEANRTLFLNRFSEIVQQMGAILERTSFSVNVKERLDFSCALLDNKGELIVNAPHIPVHLGSLGVCVREVVKHLPLQEGDIAITNHPAYGGSHLPDITLISPVFVNNKLIGYVANRAHHAEIGGKTPGSMPTDAVELKEEGVIIEPMLLVSAGKILLDEITQVFTTAPYPTRAIEENLADLKGALASIYSGIEGLKLLCELYGSHEVQDNMLALKSHAHQLLFSKIKSLVPQPLQAEEKLDDGSQLKIKIEILNEELIFDFSGSETTHPLNLNANKSIVQSVVLYVLRLLIEEDLPLNEGLMQGVKLILPTGILNPDFSKQTLPAVVGGNTEVSQRLTDTLLKCFELAACSQGTMNNLLFGNDKFGYYETIGGGTGAGPSFHGHDAIHQHMTNTRITDPEILELRYPVILNEFSIRSGSGGNGKYKGGNGIYRAFTFLDKMTITVLTQHRTTAPYGLQGGEPGKSGKQWVIKANGTELILKNADQVELDSGDQLIIETPGGGGFGLAQ